MRRPISLLLAALLVVLTACAGPDPKQVDALRAWVTGQPVVEDATTTLDPDKFGQVAYLKITLRPEVSEPDVLAFAERLWQEAARRRLDPRVHVQRDGFSAPLSRNGVQRRDEISLMYAVLGLIGPGPNGPAYGARGAIGLGGDIFLRPPASDRVALSLAVSDPDGPVVRALAARTSRARWTQVQIHSDGQVSDDRFTIGDNPDAATGRALVVARRDLAGSGGPTVGVQTPLLLVDDPIDAAAWRRVVAAVAGRAPQGGVRATRVDGMFLQGSLADHPAELVAAAPAYAAQVPAGLRVTGLTVGGRAGLASDVPLARLSLEGWRDWPLNRVATSYQVSKGADGFSFADDAELEAARRMAASLERARAVAPRQVSLQWNTRRVRVGWTTGEVSDEQLVALFRALRGDHDRIDLELTRHMGGTNEPGQWETVVRFSSSGRGRATGATVAGTGRPPQREAEMARLVALWDSTAG